MRLADLRQGPNLTRRVVLVQLNHQQAHLRRLCKVCELEKTNKLKDWIHGVVYPETPEPGKKPKKMKTVQQVIGVKEDIEPDPGELASEIENDWTGQARRELSQALQTNVVRLQLDDDDEDPDSFETSVGTVYRDEDTAKRGIYAKTIERIQEDPDSFSTDLIRRFVDTEKLSRLIRMDVREFDDPWEYLADVFGPDKANSEAVRIAGLNAEAAATFALTSNGWPHQLEATYLPSGAVAVPR